MSAGRIDDGASGQLAGSSDRGPTATELTRRARGEQVVTHEDLRAARERVAGSVEHALALGYRPDTIAGWVAAELELEQAPTAPGLEPAAVLELCRSACRLLEALQPWAAHPSSVTGAATELTLELAKLPAGAAELECGELGKGVDHDA